MGSCSLLEKRASAHCARKHTVLADATAVKALQHLTGVACDMRACATNKCCLREPTLACTHHNQVLQGVCVIFWLQKHVLLPLHPQGQIPFNGKWHPLSVSRGVLCGECLGRRHQLVQQQLERGQPPELITAVPPQPPPPRAVVGVTHTVYQLPWDGTSWCSSSLREANSASTLNCRCCRASTCCCRGPHVLQCSWQ